MSKKADEDDSSSMDEDDKKKLAMLSDNDDDDEDGEDVDIKDIMKDSSSEHDEEEAKEEAPQEQPATQPLAGSIQEPQVIKADQLEEAKADIKEEVAEEEEVKEPESIEEAVPARCEDAQQETDKIDTKEQASISAEQVKEEGDTGLIVEMPEIHDNVAKEIIDVQEVSQEVVILEPNLVHQNSTSGNSASAEKPQLSGGDSASADFANELFSDIERVKHYQQKRLSDDFPEQHSQNHGSQIDEREQLRSNAPAKSDQGGESAVKKESEGNRNKDGSSGDHEDKDQEDVDDEAGDNLLKDSSDSDAAAVVEEEKEKPETPKVSQPRADVAATKAKANPKDSESDNQGSFDQDDDDDDNDGVDLDEDDDDSANMSAGKKAKMLEDMMKKDDDDDDDESEQDEDGGDDNGSQDSDSVLGEDIANRSLNAEDEDELIVCDNMNYLKYVSDRYNQQTDPLEIVDKNERSFKHLAEKMIFQTSYLVQSTVENSDDPSHVGPTARRLMHFKNLPQVTESYHASQSKNGFPYAISALEQFIGIGSSDGGVRIYDQHERELKLLQEKSVKGIPVMSLDIIRMREASIYVVAGHQKGQVALYEVKGLYKYQEPVGIITSKHLKTITDIHEHPVISIKFFGDCSYSQKRIQVVSSDLDGIVYLSYFQEGILSYQCAKQCFMKRRIGPTFSIAPYLSEEDLQNGEDPSQQMQQQSQDISQLQVKTQLIAFGSLSRILIAQITPKAKELLFIDKPDYIDQGTVPYIDWGQGLSPCCRDRSYPMLAIAWGKILQLALYTNPGAAPEEVPTIQYDGFYICEHSIDSCFFLTESILFVLVNKKEVRILYTQNFTPGLFDETYQLNDLTGAQKYVPSSQKLQNQQDRKLYFMHLKDKFVGQVSTYAEKDKGYRLLQTDEIKFKDNPYVAGNNMQQRSNYNYNPTICGNKSNLILALGKATIGLGRLLHFEEYLDLIRKTNQDADHQWLMVLRAALDIYNGKLIGLAGIPDHKETREQMLRDEMKDLLRENIGSCIREFQEGTCQNTKTLRVALEFCIRVNALDHLFGELFLMFAEAGMEQRFFENLEPFILSGKFKQQKIPRKILVRLIEYYRQKDVELLEKILLNLNLAKYKNILEVRHICETEFLTSALIHILTNLFDNDEENTVCLQLLCSLYNMMMKSTIKKEKSDIFKLLSYDHSFTLSSMLSSDKPQEEELPADPLAISRKEKLEIEHSQTYIGYKLMWVMKMFLEGKKFPQGTLSAFKWRIYVYDIVRFATNQQFLSWFLAFDPDCFFKLMKTLFLDQEPYEYITSQQGFIEMYKEKVNGLDACMTHTQIIDALHEQIVQYIAKDKETSENGLLSAKGEQALNSFIFFVAAISRKPQVPIPAPLGSFTVREHLKFYRKLMKFPEIISEAINKMNFVIPQSALSGGKKGGSESKLTKLYFGLIKKNERDVISLLQRCENELDPEEVQRLWHDAERSPMFKVRVYLLQMQGNHKECLEMYFKLPAIREDVFIWLNDIESRLQLQEDQEHTAEIRETINSLILYYVPRLVDMEPSQTIKLVEQWFINPDDDSIKCDHLQIVDKHLKGEELLFKYLSTLISEKEDSIQEEHQRVMLIGGGNSPGSSSSSVSGLNPFSQSTQQSTSSVCDYGMYKELMLRFVRCLLSIISDKRYRGLLADFVKKKFVPLEESCTIIQEYLGNQQKRLSSPKLREINESLAILSKRQGQSERGIDLYIQVLIDLSQSEVVSELYVCDGDIAFEDPKDQKVHVQKFDSLVSDIVKICEKVGGSEAEQDSIWSHALRAFYRVKQAVFEEVSKFQSSKQAASAHQKENKDVKRFSTFHMIRVQYFLRRMSETVSIPRIVALLEQINSSGTTSQPIKYQDCRKCFEDKMRTESNHEDILVNTATLLLKDLNADFAILKSLHQKGIPNERERCDQCKRGMVSRWDPQPVCVYTCGHSYHQRCASNNNWKCTICPNEHEDIQSIISQRGVRRVVNHGKQPRREDSEDRDPSNHREPQAVAPPPKKTLELESQHKTTFLDHFQLQMQRLDTDQNERIMKLDYFKRVR